MIDDQWEKKVIEIIWNVRKEKKSGMEEEGDSALHRHYVSLALLPIDHSLRDPPLSFHFSLEKGVEKISKSSREEFLVSMNAKSCS